MSLRYVSHTAWQCNNIVTGDLFTVPNHMLFLDCMIYCDFLLACNIAWLFSWYVFASLIVCFLGCLVVCLLVCLLACLFAWLLGCLVACLFPRCLLACLLPSCLFVCLHILLPAYLLAWLPCFCLCLSDLGLYIYVWLKCHILNVSLPSTAHYTIRTVLMYDLTLYMTPAWDFMFFSSLQYPVPMP